MEPIENILSEMREFADKDSQTIGRDVLRRKIQHFADRIKVAVAENATTTPTCDKSSQVGNAAALRVALSDACHAMFNFLKTQYGSCYEEMAKALDKAKLALAKPPRNCDVYATEADRQSAFINWYNEAFDLKGGKYAIDICDLKHNIDDILHEYIDFLFAEAKRE